LRTLASSSKLKATVQTPPLPKLPPNLIEDAASFHVRPSSTHAAFWAPRQHSAQQPRSAQNLRPAVSYTAIQLENPNMGMGERELKAPEGQLPSQPRTSQVRRRGGGRAGGRAGGRDVDHYLKYSFARLRRALPRRYFRKSRGVSATKASHRPAPPRQAQPGPPYPSPR
jgi:hypothetical protein